MMTQEHARRLGRLAVLQRRGYVITTEDAELTELLHRHERDRVRIEHFNNQCAVRWIETTGKTSTFLFDPTSDYDAYLPGSFNTR